MALDGPSYSVTLFGLAPCGVLPATDVTAGAVRSYRTFSPLPFDSPASREAGSLRAVYFLCHCPSSCPARALPGALPFGVRTFLSPPHLQALGGRSSGRLRHSIVACRSHFSVLTARFVFRFGSAAAEAAAQLVSAIRRAHASACASNIEPNLNVNTNRAVRTEKCERRRSVYPSTSCLMPYCSSFL